MTDVDRDLRNRFAALRDEEKARTPQLLDILRSGHVRGRSKSMGMLIAASAVLALAATIVVVVGLWPAPERGPRGLQRPAASITQWKSPTAFLLDTPGRTSPIITFSLTSTPSIKTFLRYLGHQTTWYLQE